MKINKVYEGVTQKELILEKICKKFKVKPDEVAYIGNDVNDLDY